MVLLLRVGKSTLRAIAENSAKLLEFLIVGHINLTTQKASREPYHTADWTSAGIWRRLVMPVQME
jgi:hypothetical protein